MKPIQSLSRAFALLAALAFATPGCGGDPADAPVASPGDGSAPPEGTASGERVSRCANELKGVTTLSIPTVWSNGPSPCDYLVEGVVSVGALLTIEPGTVVQFGQDATVFVQQSASLEAVGRADARIRLVGARDVQGFWNGIYLFMRSAPTRIEYVDLENAGQTGDPELKNFAAISGSGPLTLKHSRIAKSFAYGANLTRTPIAAFEDNVFEDNRANGVSIQPHQVEMLDAASDYVGRARPNGEPFIEVVYTRDGVWQPTTWKSCNAPYLLKGGLRVSGPLTFEAGTRVVMNRDTLIHADKGGSLIAVGTAERPVVFTGRLPGPAYWNGINLFHSQGNRFENVRIEHAGLSSVSHRQVSIQVYGPGNGSSLRIGQTTFVDTAGPALCFDRYSTITIESPLTQSNTGTSSPVPADIPYCPQ